MSQTVIRGTQILNNTVQRQDLDTSTVGQAVVTKIIQGIGITLSSTGADSGTGDVTVSSPDVVSTDAGNIATLGSDNHILVPQSQIWSVRLRSFNTVGNCNFEVAQRNCRTALSNPAHGTGIEDRWLAGNIGSLNPSFQGIAIAGAPVSVPGTNFGITSAFMRVTVQTQKTSLAAGDLLYLFQQVEGPVWRELSNDVHSVSILCRSSVANLKFGLSLRDGGTSTKTLTKLCTLGAANTITLITLPNLPVFPSGNFVTTPGSPSYFLGISLAIGSTYINSANDVWTSGNLPGAVGQDNFLANVVNSTFEVFFVQHEPGPLCTTLIDCPFIQNYDDCLRYFSKSWAYGVKPGTSGGVYGVWATVKGITGSALARGYVPYPKRMAKTPSVLIYDPTTTNAPNSVFWESPTASGSTTVSSVGADETAIMQMVPGGSAAGPILLAGNWTADTSW